MNRFVVGLVAVNALVIGLVLASVAGLAIWPGVRACLQTPAFPPLLRDGVPLAGAACLVGAALGLAAGACLRRAGSRLVPAAAVLVVFLPVPALTVLPVSVETLGAADGFGAAVARAAALMLLATVWAWDGVDPAIRPAALAAGASPLQAWRHGVLAPLWRPVLLGACAAFAAALAQTQAGQMMGAAAAASEAWHLPAGLLLAAFGVAALRRAMR